MVLSGVVARLLGPGGPYRDFLQERLFGPLGMTSATPGFDDAGSWVAGSYVHATARDFARFALLYLRDGIWGGERLLPVGWVDLGRAPRSVDPDDGNLFGAHWWTRDDPLGGFWAAGHDGQYLDVVPALDLVVVRLGRTEAERSPVVRAWRDDVIAACGGSLSPRRRAMMDGMGNDGAPPMVWPTVRARDARALIAFLVDVLGFEEVVVYGDGDRVDHAELAWPLGGGLMLGSERPDDESRVARPGTLSVYVACDDPDALLRTGLVVGCPHRVRAARHRVRVPRRVGPRPEGNHWTFGTYRGGRAARSTA